MLCSPTHPFCIDRQALSPVQSSQTDCWEARNLLAPLDLPMTSTSKRGRVCIKPKCPHLKSVIIAAQTTCACLERLQTCSHFTAVPTGMRRLSCCLFLQSILGILFPLKHTRILVSHLFCTEATSFLVKKGGDEYRLTNNHHHAMLCYATAQTPEAWQTPRLGFLTYSVSLGTSMSMPVTQSFLHSREK